MKTINWFAVVIGVATLMEVATIGVWVGMRHHLARWIWWSGLVALLLVALHCAGYWLDFLWLAQVTAISNAALVLLVVYTFSQTTVEVEKLELEVKIQDGALNTERSAARQLTELLNVYKTKIQYYEDMAARHSLPPFKE